jgi:hypothetical protein
VLACTEDDWAGDGLVGAADTGGRSVLVRAEQVSAVGWAGARENAALTFWEPFGAQHAASWLWRLAPLARGWNEALQPCSRQPGVHQC